MNEILFISVCILTVIKFLGFKMQRATKLISRGLGIPNDVTSRMHPKWFSLIWSIIIARWVILLVIAIQWSWVVSILLIFFDFALIAVPLPHRTFVPIFRHSIARIKEKDNDAGTYLEMLLNLYYG